MKPARISILRRPVGRVAVALACALSLGAPQPASAVDRTTYTCDFRVTQPDFRVISLDLEHETNYISRTLGGTWRAGRAQAEPWYWMAGNFIIKRDTHEIVTFHDVLRVEQRSRCGRLAGRPRRPPGHHRRAGQGVRVPLWRANARAEPGAIHYQGCLPPLYGCRRRGSGGALCRSTRP